MTEKLYRKPTDYTPHISFDPLKQKFELSGIARPENTYEFFEPILNWVEDYVKKTIEAHESGYLTNETFLIVFNFKYINSSSSKYIFQIITNFKKLLKRRLNVNIYWYYDDPDDQILEDGEDFSEIIDIPFKFISRNKDSL